VPRAPGGSSSLTPPIQNPGAEGGSGGSTAASAGTTGSVGATGRNLRPGQASAVDPSRADQVIDRANQRINSTVMRSICRGC
jgi:hypothetical protein